MIPTGLPIWAQALFYIIIALGAGGAGIYKYLKTEEKTAESLTSSITKMNFVDSKLLKDLIEIIRETQEERGRDSKKDHRLSQDLKESINELNETIIVHTDATSNLVRFINRGPAKPKEPEL